MIGVALRRAASRTSRPGRLAWNSARASAWRRIRSDSVRFPSCISFARKRSVTRIGLGLVLGLAGDGRSARHAIASRRPGLALAPYLDRPCSAVLDAGGVERAPDDVVLDRREVLHPAAAHQDHRVLLEVVADARDVGRDLHLVREPDARDLPKRRVRLLRGHRPDLQADAALLRGAGDRHLALSQAVPVLAQRGRLDLLDLRLPPVAHELADGRHGDAVLSKMTSGGGLPGGQIPLAGRSGRGPLVLSGGGCPRRPWRAGPLEATRAECSNRARSGVKRDRTAHDPARPLVGDEEAARPGRLSS